MPRAERACSPRLSTPPPPTRNPCSPVSPCRTGRWKPRQLKSPFLQCDQSTGNVQCEQVRMANGPAGSWILSESNAATTKSAHWRHRRRGSVVARKKAPAPASGRRGHGTGDGAPTRSAHRSDRADERADPRIDRNGEVVPLSGGESVFADPRGVVRSAGSADDPEGRRQMVTCGRGPSPGGTADAR